MSILEIQEEYNKLLAIVKESVAFFKSSSKEQRSKECCYPEFTKIIMRLSFLMMEYEKITGEEMNEIEMFKGFH